LASRCRSREPVAIRVLTGRNSSGAKYDYSAAYTVATLQRKSLSLSFEVDGLAGVNISQVKKSINAIISQFSSRRLRESRLGCRTHVILCQGLELKAGTVAGCGFGGNYIYCRMLQTLALILSCLRRFNNICKKLSSDFGFCLIPSVRLKYRFVPK
jgi:hypothetical protein